MAQEEKLGIAGTIGFTLVTLAMAAVIGYLLAVAFFGLLAGDSALAPPAFGLLDISPKLQSWAAVLALKFAPAQSEAGVMAALEVLVVAAVALGAAVGFALQSILRPLAMLPGPDLARVHALWTRRMERRWFAIAVLAVVILFEVLRSEGYAVTPQEAVPYFDLQDMWFDLVPLVFGGFLLAQVALIRQKAAQ